MENLICGQTAIGSLPLDVPRQHFSGEIICISDDEEQLAPIPFALTTGNEVIEISDDDEEMPSTSAAAARQSDDPYRGGGDLYHQLLLLDEDKGLVSNIDPFQCDMCNNFVDVSKGIILRNCMHRFCEECLKLLISKANIDLRCPYFDNDGICDVILEDFEIKFALSPAEYEMYLKRVNTPSRDLYMQLLSLEQDKGLITNNEPFDCDICMNSIEFNEGIILRNCLHRFCKECIERTIIHCENVEIKCPYIDNHCSCEGKLEDREIRSALSTENYEQYLNRGLRLAQRSIKGSLLCTATDCDGWCICDEEINEFTCPGCGKLNCVTCKVRYK